MKSRFISLKINNAGIRQVSSNGTRRRYRPVPARSNRHEQGSDDGEPQAATAFVAGCGEEGAKDLFPVCHGYEPERSQELNIIPVGKENTVSVASKLNTPGFQGSYLPETRSIGKDGFTAQWNVLQLNRNYPQKWIGDKYKIGLYSCI